MQNENSTNMVSYWTTSPETQKWHADFIIERDYHCYFRKNLIFACKDGHIKGECPFFNIQSFFFFWLLNICTKGLILSGVKIKSNLRNHRNEIEWTGVWAMMLTSSDLDIAPVIFGLFSVPTKPCFCIVKKTT